MGGISGFGRPLAHAAVSMAMACALSAPALANPSMTTGDITSQPIGHYDFCKRLPAECGIEPDDQRPLRLSDELWDEIKAINVSLNAAITAVSDMEGYGQVEYWTYPDEGFGDCEDYALEKRRTLMEAGISLANLLITVVRKRDGEGHAVLTVRTERGDYILDNLTDEVRLWSNTGYQFLKRQASDHTGRWVSLKHDANMLVGALR